MKAINYIWALVVSMLILTTSASAQLNEDLPHSTINIIRSGNFLGSACQTNITLQNQREFMLSGNSLVKYKVYSEGDISITVGTYCPSTQHAPGSSSAKQIVLPIKRGNEYYVLYNAGTFKQVEAGEVKKYTEKPKNVAKYEENLENPINKSSVASIARKGSGQGTCFLISSEGYLITNFHCIENAKEITVKGIDGDFSTKYGAIVVGSDPSNDLAILRINNKNVKFTTPPFAIKSYGVVQAEKVYALGYPQAASMGSEIKVTEGIISSKSGMNGDISKYQISAAVNPGNSGGPLIDDEGNLIGVVYAKASIADAAGYAIKAGYLETFLHNIEGLTYPSLTNLLKEKTIPQKIAEIKNYIYIVETN